MVDGQKMENKKIPTFVIRGIMTIVGFFILIFFISILATVVTIGASNGIHTGFVTALEYNSNLIWEANLVYFKSERESSQEDTYCVNDEDVKKSLEKAQRDKKEVTIYYENNFFMWKWQCNGGLSIIYKVE